MNDFNYSSKEQDGFESPHFESAGNEPLSEHTQENYQDAAYSVSSEGLEPDASEQEIHSAGYTWNDDDVQVRLKNSIPHNQSLNVVKPKVKKSHKGFWQVISVSLIGAIFGSCLTMGTFAIVGGFSKYQSPVYTNTPRTETQGVNPSTMDTSSRELSNQEIVEKVGSAVVGITSKSASTNPFTMGQTIQSSGSGIIISADGYIITNNHVIEGATELTVGMISGEEYTATLVGRDPKTDIALLKIDVSNLPYAILGDSSTLKAGERVVAIGNPLMKELAGTVTVGVLSAINRNIEVSDELTGEVKQMTMLQTDAAINPGNSGGALINAYGEVIGINTLKTVSSEVEGLGFAIPINEAKPIIDSLMEKGYVSRPSIGITITPVTSGLSKRYSIPEGLYIQQVKPFSSAERGGLRAGDIILQCNGQDVRLGDELNKLRDEIGVGGTLTFVIDRNGEKQTIEITLLEDKTYAPDNHQ